MRLSVLTGNPRASPPAQYNHSGVGDVHLRSDNRQTACSEPSTVTLPAGVNCRMSRITSYTSEVT